LLILTLLNALELAWYAPFKLKKSNLRGAVQNGRGTLSSVPVSIQSGLLTLFRSATIILN
ncbi:hypothetical protein BRY75_09625, partial [Acinetobacter baumannii]|uniref:hypothetical protein n=1 Tax=Acinetobacter baumannii TaxID=470 RepID=UPI00092AEB2E